MKQHRRRKGGRAPVDHSPDSENCRFSNCMRDAVRSICQICGSPETWNNMRNHTKKVHGIRITDYKQQYGQLTEHLVAKVFHKCGVCGRVLLLDPDVVKPIGAKPNFYCEAIELVCGGSPRICVLVEWKVPVERFMGVANSFH